MKYATYGSSSTSLTFDYTLFTTEVDFLSKKIQRT